MLFLIIVIYRLTSYVYQHVHDELHLYFLTGGTSSVCLFICFYLSVVCKCLSLCVFVCLSDIALNFLKLNQFPNIVRTFDYQLI